ncbi:hypothetical protein [Dyadobacter sp. CY312]|uniref:hypothetical protein n=1 Tax=Dyadobacter sp. CY312 TaxID=2907303 RepID=UPI001F478E83|nr:hypothetical protein [Dyadobacter sp. CY312]MCE7041128.1 hypothetical protein [Dyadobacter sp. CY312]
MKTILTALFIIFVSFWSVVIRLYKSQPDKSNLHNLGLTKELNMIAFTSSQETITFPPYDF